MAFRASFTNDLDKTVNQLLTLCRAESTRKRHIPSLIVNCFIRIQFEVILFTQTAYCFLLSSSAAYHSPDLYTIITTFCRSPLSNPNRTRLMIPLELTKQKNEIMFKRSKCSESSIFSCINIFDQTGQSQSNTNRSKTVRCCPI